MFGFLLERNNILSIKSSKERAIAFSQQNIIIDVQYFNNIKVFYMFCTANFCDDRSIKLDHDH